MCGEISSEGSRRQEYIDSSRHGVPHSTRTRGRYAWAGESMIPDKVLRLISVPILERDKDVLY